RDFPLEPDAEDGKLGAEEHRGPAAEGDVYDGVPDGQERRLKLGPDQLGDLGEECDDDEEAPGPRDHQRREEVRDLGFERRTFHGHQRSISPRTMSRLPMMAMMSAIIPPLAISWKSPMATKQGERPLTRYGMRPPSLTM